MHSEITAAMISAAETLEKHARRYRTKAADIERESALRRRQQAAFEALPLTVTPAAFAAAHKIPPDTVYAWQKRKRRADRAAKRAERNREIMRLAALGWTNAEIGRRVRLSPGYVSQVISKTLRGRLWPAL